jgi:KaiC/GvpD/RAD55 family RecA-like ATPase
MQTNMAETSVHAIPLAGTSETRTYVERCGGALNAVRIIVCLGRALWKIQAKEKLFKRAAVYRGDGRNIWLKQNELHGIMEGELLLARSRGAPESMEARVAILWQMLLKHGYVTPVAQEDRAPNDLIDISNSLYHPSSVCAELLSPYLGHAQTEYWLRREKRDRFRLSLDPFVIRAFHLFASVLNSYCSASFRSEITPAGESLSEDFARSDLLATQPRGEVAARRTLSREHLFEALRCALMADWEFGDGFLTEKERTTPKDAIRDVTTAFIETCLMVRAMTVSKHYVEGGAFELRAEYFDAEYLMVHLFGMPTSIRGLDQLFGGGGIILAEGVDGQSEDDVTGRVILVRGRSGLGKSLLCLQIALEVAKKGGVGWVCPLEQSPTDSLYSLEATFHRDMNGVRVLVGVAGAATLEEVRTKALGALVLVPTIKSSMADFLESLVETAARMRSFDLKLLVVDPVNSVRHIGESWQDIRAQLVDAFDKIKNMRVNLVLVGEEDENGRSEELEFMEKVCDTSVRLSVESRDLYSRKFFEIRKSRLQREHRGKHPYSIVSGEGYVIQPSTAAVAARIRNRRVQRGAESNRFGVPGLDNILGPTALAVGDVIVLAGAQGCWRREMGMAFLLGKEGPARRIMQERQAAPLLVGFGRSGASLRAMLNEDYMMDLSRGKGAKNPGDVRVLGLPPGYLNPGHVFQKLEVEFAELRRAGFAVDRVLVDGVGSLEGLFPLLAEDSAFPGILVEFFRRQRVTSAYVIGPDLMPRPASSAFVISESCDVLINLRRSPDESGRVQGHITKAHGARYRKGWFWLDFQPGQGFVVSEAAVGQG